MRLEVFYGPGADPKQLAVLLKATFRYMKTKQFKLKFGIKEQGNIL